MSNAAAEEALAHCHISSLLSRYYQAIDVANFTALDDEVLADDAVWEVVQHSPTGGTIEDTVSGRADIVAWFEQIMGGEVSMSEGTVRHFINTHVITVDGDHAHSTSHLQAVGTDSMAILSVGFAQADHVRTARGWRIRRYRLDEHITDADMAAFKAAFDTTDGQ
jgi:ketosteroid isomerase-like protein